jgi:hypothetical protein
MSIRKKEVVSHPKIVKMISVLTALFMIGTFAVNGYIMVSGYMLNWGFYPNKTTPNIVAHFDIPTNTTSVSIPFYVNNTGMIGFPVVDLRADFTISNSSGTIVSTSNGPWTIPYPGNLTASLTLVEANNLTLYNILSATAVTITVDFQVSYAFATTSFNIVIDFPGGLTFT